MYSRGRTPHPTRRAWGAALFACLGGACTPDAATATGGAGGTTSSTATTGASSATGEGGAGCAPRWTAALGDVGFEVAPRATGGAFVADASGEVSEVDCDGLAVKSFQPNAGRLAFLAERGDGAVEGAGTLVTGTTLDRFYFEVPSGGRPIRVPLPATTAEFLFEGANVGAELWLVGASTANPTIEPRLWRVDRAAVATTCETDLGLPAGAWTTGIAPDDAGGAFVATTGLPTTIQRVTCTAACTCGAALFSNGFPTNIFGRGLARAPSGLYLIGVSDAYSGAYRVDPATGEVAGSFDLDLAVDAGAAADLLFAVAADDTSVFVAGATGVADPHEADPKDGHGVLVILPANFGADAKGTVVELPMVRYVSSLAVDGDGVLLAGRRDDASGFVARCSKSGVCPDL